MGLLSLSVLDELQKKMKTNKLINSRDKNVEDFFLNIIDQHFPKNNELRVTRSKDIFDREMAKLFKELDTIVNSKKKAAK